MNKQTLQLLTILVGTFVLTSGLCCEGLRLQISLSPTTDIITVITKDTIPTKYNKYCTPQFDNANGVYIYRITERPLIIYKIGCTTSSDLSKEKDFVESNLPIDYLKIIRPNRNDLTANSKKEIVDLFVKEGEPDGNISF